MFTGEEPVQSVESPKKEFEPLNGDDRNPFEDSQEEDVLTVTKPSAFLQISSARNISPASPAKKRKRTSDVDFNLINAHVLHERAVEESDRDDEQDASTEDDLEPNTSPAMVRTGAGRYGDMHTPPYKRNNARLPSHVSKERFVQEWNLVSKIVWSLDEMEWDENAPGIPLVVQLWYKKNWRRLFSYFFILGGDNVDSHYVMNLLSVARILADVDVLANFFWCRRDHDMLAPIHIATLNGWYQVVLQILEFGGNESHGSVLNVDAPTYRSVLKYGVVIADTPLHIAAREGFADVRIHFFVWFSFRPQWPIAIVAALVGR